MLHVVEKEELESFVGKSLGHSEWLEITQDRVNQFADATLDHQFIHIDEEQAAKTPFGGTIAHGFLTLSLLSHLCAGVGVVPKNVVMGVNFGMNKVRFLNPVRVGSKVRAQTTLKEVVEKAPGQYLFTTEVTVEIEGVDKPALIAEWLTMTFTG